MSHTGYAGNLGRRPKGRVLPPGPDVTSSDEGKTTSARTPPRTRLWPPPARLCCPFGGRRTGPVANLGSRLRRSRHRDWMKRPVTRLGSGDPPPCVLRLAPEGHQGSPKAAPGFQRAEALWLGSGDPLSRHRRFFVLRPQRTKGRPRRFDLHPASRDAIESQPTTCTQSPDAAVGRLFLRRRVLGRGRWCGPAETQGEAAARRVGRRTRRRRGSRAPLVADCAAGPVEPVKSAA